MVNFFLLFRFSYGLFQFYHILKIHIVLEPIPMKSIHYNQYKIHAVLEEDLLNKINIQHSLVETGKNLEKTKKRLKKKNLK